MDLFRGALCKATV